MQRTGVTMKVDIKNFGPIRKFSYDLDKDLVITYGNNNIGKSYAMQIVYLLLKTFLQADVTHRYYFKGYFISYNSSVSINDLEVAVEKFMDSDECVRDITELITGEVYKLIKEMFFPEFLNSCGNTFGNFDKTLENNPIITVSNEKYTFEFDLNARNITGKNNMKAIRLRRTESDFHKSRNYADHLDIYVVSDVSHPVERMKDEILQRYIDAIYSVAGRFADVHFLPASRSGIYSGMNAFGSIVAELSKNRAFFTKKIEFPGISEPISDYFISLSNITRVKANDYLSDFYTRIEKEILKGSVTLDRTKNALIYRPHNVEANFEMTEVSSMVSEISPIVAFLKYVIAVRGNRRDKRKSILFIEEPEAHLHPYNQIALIEVFAELIQSDIKLIMSSHSNYIFNKLNNLVLSKKLDYKRYQPIILEEGNGDGSISKSIEIDELGAVDENFADVSERLYCERQEIIRSLNEEE